ncbi:aminomethyl-transferring glycine dehydrogenase subunit GcvPB [Acidiferrobacter sp.]|uniref:aminomethyl-transferring glycine dehydrogenase subunit GcvPB n=1 Tax=Acidiferrobacter sp. TaxID=1872107 RepID=UPI00345C3B9D
MLIFECGAPGRANTTHMPPPAPAPDDIPQALLRRTPPSLPEVSELQVVRHYTRLSQRNFAIDTHFYPLGSCTMKYNPRAAHVAALLPGFANRHPLAPESTGQGLLACLFELQEILKAVTGMRAVSLTPMAGAQGEFAGVAMIRAYHAARHDLERDEILIPKAAHGTNPATAAMCGYRVREIDVCADGDIDLAALDAALGPKTAGLMLTNPSTLGVFDRHIEGIAQRVHAAGGLLYYDGANLNAILGQVKPGDMGFDVVHLNLHKTFATPHGGGGPGAGPVGVGERLLPFLPVPMVGESGGRYYWITEKTRPQSIGRLSTFTGNVGVLLRAYVYARLVGRTGMARIAQYATLNANYLLDRLSRLGYEPAYRGRRAAHEFLLTLKGLKERTGVTALDVAKRLLDKGYHAPTIYFPLMVPECLLIEPTETEGRAEIDGFVAAMAEILTEAETRPEVLKTAPHTLPVRRVDEVRAARELDLTWGSRAAEG